MQNSVQDLFDINFSRDVRYDTVSTYVILIISLLLNELSHQRFCGASVHDTG